MKRWTGLTFLLLVFLFFSACSKLSKKGTAPSNVPPEVFIVNIPTDSTQFSSLDTLYWYGFDQDGYITNYQYLVIEDTVIVDTVTHDTIITIPKDSDGYILSSFVQTIESMSPENWNDSYLSSTLKIDRSYIHAVDSAGTFDKVMFFASPDTSAVVPQYFFVRAVDNEGAVSKIWKPDSEKGSNFRFFKRTNTPPNTSIKYDTTIVEYCLPETTIDWGGIRIGWSGIDPDYKKNPPLTYSWKLYGPYASKPPKDIDTTKDLYYYSWDGITNSPWVDSTSRLLVNLINGSVGGEDIGYGWYQFRVQARDDAFVPDPTPAIATFKIIKPPFLFSKYDEKSVLLVDVTNGGGLYYPHRDSLRAFYMGFLQELEDSTIIQRFSFTTLNPPPETLLSQYKLVIYINEGRFSAIQGRYNFPSTERDTGFIQIERYLRVGGRVWMIGYNNFGLLDDLCNPQYMPIVPGNQSYGYTETAVRVANYFFGVVGYFNPAMGGCIDRTEEMIAAEPYETHPELPLLEVDSVKLKVLPGATDNGYFYGIQTSGVSLKGIPRAGFERIWNSNYNERLYTFISYKGTASQLHGTACASRAYSLNPLTYYDENGQPILQWRTAEFCFPAFAMKKEPMQRMMEKMVRWFLDEQPYLP